MPLACPAQSNGARRRSDGPMRERRTSATDPTGMLMRKMNRQLADVSSPPSTGPADDAAAPPIAHMAMARARRGPLGYAWPSRAIEDGIITAAAPPWTNRPATSAPSEGANPHAADPVTNSATPAANA